MLWPERGKVMADIISTLSLDVKSLSKDGTLLLIDIRPVKRYVDGKPTDDNDYKCVVVAPKNGYNRYEITVSEKPAFDVVEGEPIPVIFNNLMVKIYRAFKDSTGYGLSCRAQSVALVKKA